MQTEASLSRLCKLSLFRRHLDVLSSCSRLDVAPIANASQASAGPTEMDAERSEGQAGPSALGEDRADSNGQGALIGRVDGKQQDAHLHGARQDMRYLDAKRQDSSYRLARRALLAAFEKLGVWLVNDEALSQWTCKGGLRAGDSR